MLRYWNRLKRYFAGDHEKHLPGGFYEKIVVDVFIKFFLDLICKIINPILRKRTLLRHERLTKERNIFLNRLRESSVKYHDYFETFVHIGYRVADVDVPYFQTYNEAVKIIQKDFPEHDKLSKFEHDFNKGAEPRIRAEKVNSEMIREGIESDLIEKKDRVVE